MIVEAIGFAFEEVPWMARAACAGAGHHQFFPAHGQSADKAKEVCSTCPVAGPCLDYALRWKISFGVWGGLSERERRRLEPTRPLKRVQAAHGTTTRYSRGCRCQACRDANYRYKVLSEEAS